MITKLERNIIEESLYKLEFLISESHVHYQTTGKKDLREDAMKWARNLRYVLELVEEENNTNDI